MSNVSHESTVARIGGELRPLAGGKFEARIRIDAKRRKGFALSGIAAGDRAAARSRTSAMALIPARLRDAGLGDEIEKTLERAARARVGREWHAVQAGIDLLCGRPTEVIGGSTAMTWEKLGDDWTSGRLAAKHRDHVRKKKHVEADKRIARM